MEANQPMGKILEKETMLNATSNSHIYQMSCQAGPDAALNQCILNQRKKSEEAEALGALKRGVYVEVQVRKGTLFAKVVESQLVEEHEEPPLDPSSEEGCQFTYYVTFIDMNRRMDQWIAQQDILQVVPADKVPRQTDLGQAAQDLGELAAKNCMPPKTSHNLASPFPVQHGQLHQDQQGLFQNDENKGMDQRQVEEHEQATKIKTINYVQIGQKFKVRTWYFSPFPGELQNLDTLYICENCLALFTTQDCMSQHKCSNRGRSDDSDGKVVPPGLEIYRDDKCSVFEVSGQTERLYCENLCLIAKLFLDHKNIRFDCSPFLFYVLIERVWVKNEMGEPQLQNNFAGYFSKEYGPKVEHNLSCILILPQCQRQGHGKFLIEFSYELSKIEKKKGTPERPLSDLGFRSYISWWAVQIIRFLLENDKLTKVNIQTISDETYVEQNDVLYVLENFKILRRVNNGHSQLYLKREYLETILENLGVKRDSEAGFIYEQQVQRERIKWIPHYIYE